MVTEGPVRLTMNGANLAASTSKLCLLCSGLRAGGSALCWDCIADVLAYEPSEEDRAIWETLDNEIFNK